MPVRLRLVAAGLALMTQVANAEPWRPVAGAALPTLLAGKELGDGMHFSYRFGLDHSFSGTEMGKDVRGRWRAADGALCLITAGVEECYEVEMSGAEVRLLKYGSEAWGGTLSPSPR